MDKIIQPFEKPSFKIVKQSENKVYGEYILEPLEKGFGLTLGNALRRVLLSAIPGASVYAIHIDGVLHEFSAIDGVDEDVTRIILNLKQLILKIDGNNEETKKLELEAFGPCTVHAGDLQLPFDVEVINPELEIAHLEENGHLKMTLFAKNGRGYLTNEENKKNLDETNSKQAGLIATDSNYSPVVKVNYEVEPTRVDQDSRFDSLKLEVTTDGSISAVDAITSASQILIAHFEKVLELEKVAEEKIDAFKEEEAKSVSEFVNMTIEDLDLSLRSYNCLKREGFQTVQELTQVSEEEILKLKHLGKKSFKEIEDKLAAIGLSFKKA